MNKYEIMFIVRADIDEKTGKDTVAAFEKVLTDMKAKIINTKDMIFYTKRYLRENYRTYKKKIGIMLMS